ncbi:MAG: FGGY family carbohydrate kinase, partial [Evtepia gabavorous]
MSSAQIPFSQYYPQPGWVGTILWSCWTASSGGGPMWPGGVRPGQIAGVGLANQRETALMWERETGKPVGRAIVWQCRRTAAFCTQLREQGYTEAIRARTGLLPDAYFSGTKYRWLLEHTPGARRRAERGELLCGTVDSWLLWNLTGGKVHASDYSNCCRTMIFDIHRRCWDETLSQLLDVPMGW